MCRPRSIRFLHTETQSISGTNKSEEERGQACFGEKRCRLDRFPCLNDEICMSFFSLIGTCFESSHVDCPTACSCSQSATDVHGDRSTSLLQCSDSSYRYTSPFISTALRWPSNDIGGCYIYRRFGKNGDIDDQLVSRQQRSQTLNRTGGHCSRANGLQGRG